MKRIVLKFAALMAVFVLLMMIDRALFIAVYGAASGASASELWGAAMAHGFGIDLSVAAYLTVIPALCTVARTLTLSRVPLRIERAYYWVAGALLAAVFILDLGLYGSWGFRLDMTPVFYFTTSPASALASVTPLQAVGGAVAFAVMTWLFAKALLLTAGRITVSPLTPRWRGTITALLLTGLLYLPMRGGVTVATMNLSHAYFSSNMKLNHVAVNPLFSLLYSATHQSHLDSQFRFFDSDDAARAALPDAATAPGCPTDSLSLLTERPDIYLIILESFSNHLLPSLGGEPIAVKLDSIARDGAVWTRFYANSFRTDRALPAILGGFPSQPTVSLMKYVDKAERIPGLAGELKRQAGYETSYYYGGDINFTNMQAYLRGSGFDSITSQADFSLREASGKWGAHDHTVMNRALSRIKSRRGDAPRFTVVQTSSSHEPFKVPYTNPRFADNERTNAFAYADSCLGAFVDSLNRIDPRALIVIVADHYAVWPLRSTLTDIESRHRVPLVITGGALGSRGLRLDTPGSQNDIAATLLSLLGLDPSPFPFSHDLLDPSQPHFAWIAEPETAGIITGSGRALLNTAGGTPLPDSDPALIPGAKAWLQLIYSALGK
ncbi:MAG: LTA synthase family protein [Bacteroidales bacterium]|nr:LTA synthase family protein [Bacteroidales bacterium]MBD5376627.1 LTA synthase family protein [Bacteroides sp.]